MSSANQAKAGWARGKAAAIRAEAIEVSRQPVIASEGRHVRTKLARIAALDAEAARFDRIAFRLTSACTA